MYKDQGNTAQELAFGKKGCDLKNDLACYNYGSTLLQQGRAEEAKPLFETTCKNKLSDGCYNLACYYALKSDTTNALKSLEDAFTLGFNDWQGLDQDNDLQSIRRTDKFKNLLAKYKK